MNDSHIFEIIPGILEQDWAEIEKKLDVSRKFAKAIHVDLMDGKFVGNTTFMDPAPFKKYAQDLTLELHMMVEDPMKYLQPFAACGFTRFIGHVEKMELIEEFVAEAQLFGEVGIALDSPTGVDIIEGIDLEDLDSILFMTVKAGESGQAFIPDMLEKVKEIKERLMFGQVSLEVDGGVNASTIKQAVGAGANRFVATSAIWNSENPEEAYKKLKDVLHQS